MPNKSAVQRWQVTEHPAQNGRGVSRVRCNSPCAKGAAGMDRNTNRTGSTPQQEHLSTSARKQRNTDSLNRMNHVACLT